MTERAVIVDFVERTYELSDREFKEVLRKAIEVRLTTKLHRANKNSYKDLGQVFSDFEKA